jgi:hypothetical protein
MNPESKADQIKAKALGKTIWVIGVLGICLNMGSQAPSQESALRSL